MTEAEWLEATFGLLLMQAADGRYQDADGTPTWRSVAARVACLAILGSDLPPGVQQWVNTATGYLVAEDRSASADWVLYQDRGVYAAFQDAYAHADPTLRQRLAAAQDIFRGSDYYGNEHYMLEVDESSPTYTGATYAADSAAHCDIIRDIFGNPFRPVACDPAWLAWNGGTIPKIAQALSNDRQLPAGRLDVRRMAILADALEDAGCTDSSILEHLRGGPHVLGCHVLDALLGKSETR